jgi:hypothetical protein
MKREDLVAGRIYVIAGRGEMRLDRATALVFHAHGGGHYWASEDEVVREATAEDLRRRDEQARPRGVACDDPECWCRRYGMTLGQEVFTVIQAEPDGVSYPQIAARLCREVPKAELEGVLTRLERAGFIRVEAADVSRTFLAPGPNPVVWGGL